MKHLKLLAILLTAIIATGFTATYASAADDTHKVVIQVSSADAGTQKLALNNAANILKDFGPGNVQVEIVAFGPGLSILTKKGKNTKRVANMAFNEDLTFSACNNTMQNVKKKTGHLPVLTKGVKVVPSGATQIMKLQEKGYSYLRP